MSLSKCEKNHMQMILIEYNKILFEGLNIPTVFTWLDATPLISHHT